MLIIAVPLLVSWIMLALAETIELICVFAVFAGLSQSVSNVILPMYIAEIASPRIRGYLVVLHTVASKAGLLFMYLIAPFVSFRQMAWISVIPVALFIIIHFCLPESPYHLIAINQKELAEISLQRLRCRSDVQVELAHMEAIVVQSQTNKGKFKELFFNPRNRSNLLVILGLSALNQLSGSQFVSQYSLSIFATLDSSIEPKYASIIFGFIQLAAAITTCFLVDTLGRRPLLFISVVGSGSCTLLIGIYYVLERSFDVAADGWLPFFAIVVFMMTHTIGILSMLYVVTSELFPMNIKGVAGALKTINENWISVVLALLCQYAADNWGNDYVFVGFSVVTFVFIPFVLLKVSETKQKSLDSILNDDDSEQ